MQCAHKYSKKAENKKKKAICFDQNRILQKFISCPLRCMILKHSKRSLLINMNAHNFGKTCHSNINYTLSVPFGQFVVLERYALDNHQANEMKLKACTEERKQNTEWTMEIALT